MRLVRKLLLGLLFIAALTVAFALWHPRSPLPNAWNPLRPLVISDQVTPFTQYKLNEALTSGEMCLSALSTGAEFERLEDLTVSEVCFIRDRVRLREVADIGIRPVETRCQTALRFAMWTEHGIKPAARQYFDQTPAQITHSSSYNCRQIRTVAGNSPRMSTHATAESIDITGVTLPDGRALSLLEGWTAPDERADFFKDIRDSACTWFRVTLGPEFNALHADHFHLQHTGWGVCR